MGKFRNGELASGSHGFHASFWPHRSPLRFDPEQSDQLVGRTEGALSQMWRGDGLDGLELLSGITTRIDFGGRHVGMSEPERDFPDVLCRLQHNNCGGVTSMSQAT